jgi:hypothetical protein
LKALCLANSLQQFSLSHGMSGLKTSGSRGGSPMSNMTNSHTSSPAAQVNNSPSPTAQLGFANGQNMGTMSAHGLWAASLDMATNSMPHGMRIPQHFNPADTTRAAGPGQIPYFAPSYSFNGVCKLTIHPTPLKSRVETQIPIKMTLYPIPPGIKRLHLPTHTISKPKLLAKPSADRSPDMLELYTMLVCTSAMQTPEAKQKAMARAVEAAHAPADNAPSPDEDDEESKPQNGGEVRICQNCISRERKRAARKKIKKQEEEAMWNAHETRRVIVFNTHEIKEWQLPSGVVSSDTITGGRPEPMMQHEAMQVDAPMRIACYCRHHNEKMGFQVIFTIKDFQDRVVAQEMSSSIMITDDHKTPTHIGVQPSQSSDALAQMISSADTSALVPPPGPFRMSHSSSDLQSLQQSAAPPLFAAAVSSIQPSASVGTGLRSLSRPASPTGHPGPLSKKRKASGTKLPMDFMMTRLDTSSPPGVQPSRNQAGSTAVSPFTPSLSAFPGQDSMFGSNMPTPAPMPHSFATGPPTPNSNENVLFSTANRSASMENFQIYSAPTSSHNSRAPSPNGFRNSVNAMTPVQVSQVNQAMANLYSIPMGMAQARPAPTIHKIIPCEGPKSGGIEVTVLGAGFCQGLEVLFGDQRATTTTFWGESSLVCLLPPSSFSGTVPVTLKQQPAAAVVAQSFPPMTKQHPIFKYIDDDEDKLIRTALSVLGQKMSGQMVDVRELARRILGTSGDTWGLGGPGPTGNHAGGPGYNNAAYTPSVESQLVRCLELMDMDDSANRTRLDLRRSNGQTMLHMACSLGFHRLVAGLLVRGANPDPRDNGGFTPMHMAAMNDHPEIVRRLIQQGADPTIRSLSGLAPSDVAQSRAVLRAVRKVERHVRSRSGGSLHSRVSSAASLRSLWEPMPTTQSANDDHSSGESPEYSSEDYDDAEFEESGQLYMRRSSTHDFNQELARKQLLDDAEDDLQPEDDSQATPIAAAFKDQFAAQFQQFQQTMALQLQNIQQMNFPQMPGMPMLPDYQAYLGAAAFMTRVASLVPGMSGSRPGSSGDDSTPKGLDSRWWPVFNSSPSAVPPPSYEEIFPQKDLDTKQASAALAAAEAEADSKCAIKYDVRQEAAEESDESSQAESTLKLPRKAAIITSEVRRPWLAAYEPVRWTKDKKLFFIWVSRRLSFWTSRTLKC